MQLNSITPKVANSHVTDEHEFFKQTDRLSLNTLRSVRSWNFPKSYSSSSEWYLDRFPYNTEKSCPSSSFCESDAKRAIWSGRETWSERENNLKSIDLIKVTSCWQSEYFCCSLFLRLTPHFIFSHVIGLSWPTHNTKWGTLPHQILCNVIMDVILIRTTTWHFWIININEGHIFARVNDKNAIFTVTCCFVRLQNVAALYFLHVESESELYVCVCDWKSTWWKWLKVIN